MANHNHAGTSYQQLRLCWIERFAHHHGAVHRADIAAAFGISHAQASADLQALLARFPGLLTYDLNHKTYRWSTQKQKPRLPIPKAITDLIRFAKTEPRTQNPPCT